MGLVEAPLRQKPLLVQDLQLAHGEGHREIRQRLPAMQVQHIIGSERFLGLRPLLLRGGAHGREQEPIVVQPDVALLLAQVRELLHNPVLIEPKPGFVAVFAFVGCGHHEGRPGVGRVIPGVQQKAIVQDVLLLHRSHSSSFPPPGAVPFLL